MDDLIIEHTVEFQVEYHWGYLKWARNENEKYSQIFSKDHFNILFDGQLIENCHVYWPSSRIHLPKKFHKKIIQGKILRIQKDRDLIIITSNPLPRK